MTDPLPRLQAVLADRYAIERELGRGGMATVYLAQDRKHDRPVAIKVLRPELATALGPERFLREIRIAGQLNHPHILGLYDSGEIAGFLYYVMPYVAGESLRGRLEREQQLPLGEALQIAREVADALAHAHSQGIVHRDIKPENILLSGGHAVVADFGIARALDAAGGAKLTETGIAIGTPAYMSPEQAAGSSRLDGRSDIYALGCVLYEMLAGQPPFVAPTAQGILARHAIDPVPSLRTVRATVPEGVEAAITTALAKVPADRFATAGQFVEALASGSPSAAARERGRRDEGRRRWLVPAMTLLVVAAVLLIWRPWVRAPIALNNDLVAIAPFEVREPMLEVWREGLVDVLSRSLDGAGPLRTVAPSVALKGWHGPADKASAAALGRRTGAGLVVFGGLQRGRGDSVLLRAAVLDVTRGVPTEEVEVRGDSTRLDQLTDSLAVALLNELGRTRPIGAVRHAPLAARSLPALKAFLRGEQFYRHGEWDSAVVQYDRAIGLDSNFAMALAQMGEVLDWWPETRAAYLPPDEYVARAVRLNHGLAPRDSLQLTWYAVSPGVGWQDSAYFAHRRLAFATAEEWVRRYPGDPQAWYRLGETRFHDGTTPGATAGAILEAFDRAIALDSSFTPAYEHVVGVAIAMGDPTRARRYLAAYLRQNPHDIYTLNLRLAARMLDPDLAASAETVSIIDTIPGGDLFEVGANYLSHWPDSAETAIRLLHSLVFGHHSFTPGKTLHPSLLTLEDDSLFRRRVLAYALTVRGHLREAYGLYATFGANGIGRLFNPYTTLALLGTIPPAEAARAFADSVTRFPRGLNGYQPVLPWWYQRRDTVALLRFVRVVESTARDSSTGTYTRPYIAFADYFAAAGRAYLSLARGDSAAALRDFAALPDSVCILADCHYTKLFLVQLLEARGRDREAAAILDRWAGTDPLAQLEIGRGAERLGEREKAMKAYQFVVDIWRHADPELSPYVTQAREGLARLTAERP